MLWITGANGLLGKSLRQKIQSDRCLATGREIDISDMQMIQNFARNHRGISHIINCAAFSQVDQAEWNKEAALKANATGPKNLGLLAKEIGARFIHISTDYVFPGNGRESLKETDPVGPCNYYGETKLRGEENALALDACVIRTSWIFGDGGKNFVAKLLQMLQSEKVIRLADDQWGRPTYAPDLAGAILQMLGAKGLYQYANTGISTKYQFGLTMREEAILLGFPVVTESILPVPSSTFPSPCKRPVFTPFDTTKIETIVSIRPWQQALRDFLCAQLLVCS